MSVAVDPNTNRLQGVFNLSFDANGNIATLPPIPYISLGYDAENRIISATQGYNVTNYGYDAQNKRVWKWDGSGYDMYNNVTNYSVFLYSPSGQKLGTYQLTAYVANSPGGGALNGYLTAALVASDRYFGGRRLQGEDRLSSTNGSFYPYGEDKPGNPASDSWKFASYWRDSNTNLDYADQRYCANLSGRFMTPDRTWVGTDSSRPSSWNRYAYVEGDPANYNDPTGSFLPAPTPPPEPDPEPFPGPNPQPQPQRPIPADPPNSFCDRKNPTNAKVLDFMANNQGAADAIANKTRLSSDFILAWGAFESGYGTGSAAKLNDNFFGLTAPSSSSTGGWVGAVPCATQDGKTFPGFACFPTSASGNDLSASALAALTSQNDHYLNAALSAQNAGGSIADIANAIAKAGFNSEPINYGASVRNAANAIERRKDCDK